ncbi:protein DpdG [Bacillus sp. X1(2014)]|uniref:protein DpdG n=1 Tax=Bacillus sp. X1(2014) TaxID=1565991 RepID=UPI0011A94DC1|nr:protein DpdG [Bacillus sp. X1(2014)]
MSVLNQIYATPSRVKGAYRLLLNSDQHKLNRKTAEEILSPRSLQPGVNHEKSEHLKMIRGVINETIKMGLFEAGGEEISLNKQLEGLTDENLAVNIFRLFTSDENKENDDFLRLLAWYLMQDPFAAPGTWDEANIALEKQIGGSMLGCNDNRFGQFTHWLVFLGFGWRYSLKGERDRITPDPIKLITSLLPFIFGNKEVLSIHEFIGKLATLCPVFEEGKIRDEINQEYQIETLPPKHLSKVTSFALFQLNEQGTIALASKSDADLYVLADGESEKRISEIKWIGKGVS